MQSTLALLTRHYTASWFGLVRIAGFAIATLVLIGWVAALPDTSTAWNQVSSPKGVFTMAREMDDPRGFRRLDSHNDTSKFQVAWISGSGTQVLWPMGVSNPEVNEFMPMFVQPKMAKELGQDVEILLYVLQSGTPVDKYYSLIDALRRDVDLIVYEVNPAYDFNYFSLTRRQNLFATGASTAATDSAVAARVLTWALPMDVVGALLQSRLPAIGDRWSYNHLLATRAAIPVPTVKPLQTETDPASPSARMAALSTPWPFWANYAQFPSDFWKGRVYPCNHPGPEGKTNWCSHVEAAIASSSPDRLHGATELTNENIRLLLSTGKSSIVYLSPIGPVARKSPALAERYDLMQRHLMSIGSAFGPANYCIKPGYPQSLLDNQEFSDSLHLKRSEPMASEMASTIINWVLAKECK